MRGQGAQKRAKKLKVDKAAKQQQLLRAIAWCAETGNGATAAVAWLEKDTKKPALVTRNQIDYAQRIEKDKKENPAKFEDATPNAQPGQQNANASGGA